MHAMHNACCQPISSLKLASYNSQRPVGGELRCPAIQDVLSMYLRVTHGCGCSILAPNAEASYCTFLNPCPEQSARATNHLSKALHSFASVQVWLGRSLGQWPTRADLFPHQCPYPEDSCVKSAALLNLVVGLLLKHGMRPQMSSRD